MLTADSSFFSGWFPLSLSVLLIDASFIACVPLINLLTASISFLSHVNFS